MSCCSSLVPAEASSSHGRLKDPEAPRVTGVQEKHKGGKKSGNELLVPCLLAWSCSRTGAPAACSSTDRGTTTKDGNSKASRSSCFSQDIVHQLLRGRSWDLPHKLQTFKAIDNSPTTQRVSSLFFCCRWNSSPVVHERNVPTISPTQVAALLPAT